MFSHPIQEVDIYRYCWDGAVLSEGVSPFRYSPWRIHNAFAAEPEFTLPDADPKEIAAIRLRDSDPGLATVLQRVHFSELTTIYPPASQVVFAAADRTTPKGSTVRQRLLVMKLWIVLFDIGTMIVLAAILALCIQTLCLADSVRMVAAGLERVFQ